jgi:hypothetical protein
MNRHFGTIGGRDRCRSCKKPIIWAVTTKGRRMPLDPEPVENGNLILRHRMSGLPTALYLTHGADVELQPDEKRYVSHFATCPYAAQHRKT